MFVHNHSNIDYKSQVQHQIYIPQNQRKSFVSITFPFRIAAVFVKQVWPCLAFLSDISYVYLTVATNLTLPLFFHADLNILKYNMCLHGQNESLYTTRQVCNIVMMLPSWDIGYSDSGLLFVVCWLWTIGHSYFPFNMEAEILWCFFTPPPPTVCCKKLKYHGQIGKWQSYIVTMIVCAKNILGNKVNYDFFS